MLRLLICLCVLFSVAACVQPEGQKTAARVEVDALSLYDGFFEADPSRRVFPLVNDRGRGFYVFQEPAGAVRYVALGTRAGSNLAHDVWVSYVQDNVVCFSASGSWSGACVSLYESSQPGTLFVDGRFCNGYAFEYVTPAVEQAPQLDLPVPNGRRVSPADHECARTFVVERLGAFAP